MKLSKADIDAIAAAVVAHRDVKPSNEDEPVIDEAAIRELARRDAERVRRARNR